MLNISNKAPAAPATADLAIENQPGAKSLDKFYTKPDIARQCVEDFEKWTKIDLATAATDIIEPSAGAGAFLDFLPARTLAYDLAPEDARIATQDFLALKRKKSAIVIGNPPFGTACRDAIKFFEHSATFASYIAYVVPRTFEKNSIKKKLDENFHLLYERVLPRDSFTFEGKTKSVPCVFQIWERRAYKRPMVKLPITHVDFDFVKREEAHLAVQRVGVNAAQIKPSTGEFADSSHYFLRANGSVEELIMLLLAIDFSLAKAQNSGVPSIGKSEIVALYSALNKAAVNDPYPPEGAGQKDDSVEYGTQGLYYGPENFAASRCETPPEAPRVEQEELRRAGLLERIDLRPDSGTRAKRIDAASVARDGDGVFASPTSRTATSSPLIAGWLGFPHVLAPSCAAAVVTPWAVPLYAPHVCGETLLPRRLPLDLSAVIPRAPAAIRLPSTGGRQRGIGAGWRLGETVAVRPRAGVRSGHDLKRIAPDTTGMTKTIAHLMGSRPYTARRKLLGLARAPGRSLSQDGNRLGPPLARRVGRYGYAHQAKRMCKAEQRRKGHTGRVLRAIERPLRKMSEGAPRARIPEIVALLNRLLAQKRCGRFSLPERLRFTAKRRKAWLKVGRRAPQDTLYRAYTFGEAPGWVAILPDRRPCRTFGERRCRGPGGDIAPAFLSNAERDVARAIGRLPRRCSARAAMLRHRRTDAGSVCMLKRPAKEMNHRLLHNAAQHGRVARAPPHLRAAGLRQNASGPAKEALIQQNLIAKMAA